MSCFLDTGRAATLAAEAEQGPGTPVPADTAGGTDG